MLRLNHTLLVGLIASFAVAQQCPQQADYPNVTLPWGIYQPASCDNTTNIYTFKNIRFGQDTSKYRFGPSVAPASVTNPTLQDSSDGAACPSVDPKALLNCSAGGHSPILAPHTGPSLLFPGAANQTQSEDCLFLDIYVPVSVINNGTNKVPVIVWFYGGAYLSGSKDFGAFGEFSPIPFYDGTGPIQASASQSSAIFVAGNYRLGALGWLAGTTLGAATNTTPNAGLTDQRLLLEFVRDQISNFGGDSGNVTAWGESAGGGSILHHLIAEGGSRDPLFRRALVQSAAFQWLWDPVALESIFENFVAATSCEGKTGPDAITCLQGIDSPDILNFQEQFFTGPNCGMVGPAVDNSLIKELPATALEGGRFYPIDSIIASHVDDEAALFIPQNKNFSEVLDFLLPTGYATERENITSRYYNTNDEAGSIKLLIRDAIFTCNTRYVYDGMTTKNKKTFLMHYGMFESVPIKQDDAKHATDLIPTFISSVSNDSILADYLHNLTGASVWNLKNVYLRGIHSMDKHYKSYFVQHAVSGDPNFAGAPANWSQPSQSGSFLANVMDISGGVIPAFSPDFLDQMNSFDNCTQFWYGIAKSVQNLSSSYNTERLVVQNEHSHMNMEL